MSLPQQIELSLEDIIPRLEQPAAKRFELPDKDAWVSQDDLINTEQTAN